MNLEIPTLTPYSIVERDHGAEVWAVQRAINRILDAKLVEDGDYGGKTVTAVNDYQRRAALATVDGKFGPATSRSAAYDLAAKVKLELPDGLIVSIVEGESGNLIGAVNHSVPGGIDCGYLQRRVYSPYEDSKVMHAFDGLYQMGIFGKRVKGLHDLYVNLGDEMAWRLAVLDHNYPAAVKAIAAVGGDLSKLSTYWSTAASWVMQIGAKFPDGHPITTPIEWCEHYSLGSEPHAEHGMMLKYVTF